MSTNPKKFSLLVTSAAWSSQGHITALNFAKSLLSQGHSLYRVFFYADATHVGTASAVAPQDERDIPKEWQALASEHSTDLIICITAGLKRGIINESESHRYDISTDTLDNHFELSGLGQLVDAIIQSDRVVTF